MVQSNAATPAELIGGTPPAAPAATPAATPPEGGTPKQPETVTLTKEEVDQLKRDAARASSNQRKADLYDRTVGKQGGHFKPGVPITPPTEEEKQEQAAAEDRKAERGLLSVAADPAFREVLDADPTLRNLFTASPLAVLPILAPDALDAEDAISLVKEKLNARVAEIKSKAPANPATPPAAPPVSPPSGAVNPPGATTPDAEYEDARKRPNIESAVAGMVKIGLKRLGGAKGSS